jgi:hypothetical protein
MGGKLCCAVSVNQTSLLFPTPQKGNGIAGGLQFPYDMIWTAPIQFSLHTCPPFKRETSDFHVLVWKTLLNQKYQAFL